MKNINQIILGKILQKLEEGTIPWSTDCTAIMQRNFLTNKPYSSLNRIYLGMSGFKSWFWLTLRQLESIHGTVLKGERPTAIKFISYVKSFRSSTEDGSEDKTDFYIYQMPKHFFVYNLDQVKIPERTKERILLENNVQLKNTFIPTADTIVAQYQKCPILWICNGIEYPYYNPKEYAVYIQDIRLFNNSNNYYSSLYHELIHSTGHSSRLKRFKDNTPMSDYDYALEELVAEIGSSFLCSLVNIQKVIDNQASFIANWLSALQNDTRLIFKAASKAQEAFDYITALQYKQDKKSYDRIKMDDRYFKEVIKNQNQNYEE